MSYSATELRQNLYKILDGVLETGKAVEIVRKGRKLKIVPEVKSSRLERIVPHDTIVGDPEGLADFSWEDSWHGEDQL